MISLNCAKCQTRLDVDDAFAGSACRCSNCGTIQTVPGRKRATAPAAAGSKTLYSNEARVAGQGTGLNALADVVASSGLQNQTAAKSRTAVTKSVPLSWVIGIGVVVGVVILGLIMLVLNSGSTKHQHAVVVPLGSNSPANPTFKTETSPRFLDIELNEPVVIYLIDRGSSARDSLGRATAAAIASARTLGSDRKFQILFWDNGQGDAGFPTGAPIYATAQSVNAAERAIEGVTAFGRSDALPPLRKAIAAKPGAIVLITAKGWELDDAFTKSVESARSTSNIKIHTVAVGQSGDALQTIATKTGGTSISVSPGELKDFAEK